MSILKVNTIQGVDGRGITAEIASEGGATTMSLTQGLCKAWCYSTTPATILDSFNISSQADGGTGQYDNTLASNMASNGGCVTGGSQYAENDGFGTPTASAIQQFLLSRTDSLSNQDGRVYFHLTGDLA